MAGRRVAGGDLHESGARHVAELHGVRAARVEPAAGRRVAGARHIAHQRHKLSLACSHFRNGGEQRLRVRMPRRRKQRASFRDLDDLAQIHHRDPVADVPDNAEVVRDEQIGERQLVSQILSRLRICAWIETSSADDRFVEDEKPRRERKRAGNAYALALPAGELVRKSRGVVRQEPHEVEQLDAAACRARRGRRRYGRRAAR